MASAKGRQAGGAYRDRSIVPRCREGGSSRPGDRAVIRATKKDEAGRRYLDIQRKAKQTGRPPDDVQDELIQLYARRLPRRRVTAVMTLVRMNPSLVTPADLGIFPLRPRRDLGVLDRQPVFHCCIVALVRTPRRLLPGAAPPRHVLANSHH